MTFTSLPGFREFYPDQLALRNHIFSAWRRVAARYGFVEYDGPPLEPLGLYTQKSGDEIVAQLYSFTDKGGREVALRPEMTPTFARMIAARAAGLPKPIRWFSVPQLFRYEKPQRGRLREHFQLNADVVGETDPLADAEVIALALDTLRELGLTAEHIHVRVSDRRLIAGVLGALDVPERGWPAAFAALDKQDRESPEWMRARLAEAGASETACARLTALRDLDLPGLAEAYGDGAGVDVAARGVQAVLAHLAAFGLGDFVRFDPGLVRGLAYYTGTVFEVWERSGELRAICGGGRYDDLLAALGGTDLPSVGFGMGDVVLAELLGDLGLVGDLGSGVQDFVVCVSEEQRAVSLAVARGLREAGRSVSYDIRSRGVGRQFKAADQMGAERAIVVGPDEVERGVVVVRSMASGEECELVLADVLGGAELPTGPGT